MSEQQVVAPSGGIGFGGLLAILFIGLKLGGVINWSWLWVLLPIWLPLALVLVLGVIFVGLSMAIGTKNR
jgi:hypothetical protein